MGIRRKFTDEFKREAVRLVSQPGNTLLGVSTSLGIDRSVLKRWVDKTKEGRYEPTPSKPLKSESQSELEAVKRELARVKMERDIPKKGRSATSRRPRREVRLHRQTSRGVAGSCAVSGPRRLCKRILRVARSATEQALRRQRQAHRAHPAELRGPRPDLWQPPRLARRAVLGRALRHSPRRAADAGGRSCSSKEATPFAARHRGPPREQHRAEPAAARIRGRRAEQEVAGRLHLRLDRVRNAVRGGRARPVLAPNRRLVDEVGDDRTARRRRFGDGRLATRKAEGVAAPFRPGQPGSTHRRNTS